MDVNIIVRVLEKENRFLTYEEINELVKSKIDITKYKDYKNAIRGTITSNCKDRVRNVNNNNIFISYYPKGHKGQLIGLVKWSKNSFLLQDQVDDNNDNYQISLKINEKVNCFEDRIYKPEVIINNKSQKLYKRNLEFKLFALSSAKYRCEVDDRHKTFIRKSNGKPYTEAHHLIPLSAQSEEKYKNISLDCPANIVSLCSNCHNELHYGENPVDKLKILYELRKDRLKKSGIVITFEELLKYYI